MMIRSSLAPKRFQTAEQRVVVQLPPQGQDASRQAVTAVTQAAESSGLCLGASDSRLLASRCDDDSSAAAHGMSTVSLPRFCTTTRATNTMNMGSEYAQFFPFSATDLNQHPMADLSYPAATTDIPHYSPWTGPALSQQSQPQGSIPRSLPVLTVNDGDVPANCKRESRQHAVPWKPHGAVPSSSAVDEVFARGQRSPSLLPVGPSFDVGMQHFTSSRSSGSALHQHVGPTVDATRIDLYKRESTPQHSDQLLMLIATAETTVSPLVLPKPQSPSPPPYGLPFTLSCPADQTNLATFQIYLRLHIEVFAATTRDVLGNIRGRNRQVRLHQVGLRCRHCAHVSPERRATGSTYFPRSTLGLYQSAQNMSSVHLQCGRCPQMPDAIKMVFAKLMCTKGRGSSTKGKGREYWSHHALLRGLVNTEDGIFPCHLVPVQTRREGHNQPIINSSKSPLPLSSADTIIETPSTFTQA